MIKLIALLALLLPALASADETSEAAACRDFSNYALVLRGYVQNGLVNYGELSRPADRELLAAAIKQLDSCTVAGVAASSYDEQMSYWLNAYNLLTLQLVVQHYPIQGTWLRGLKYPANSIRQIPGVWMEFKFKLAGRQVSLDDIEHKILRREFLDPRIHVALNCASWGCPVLRDEPYEGERLDAQLDEQARRFVGDSGRGMQIDPASGQVFMSQIFEWFGEDFVAAARLEQRPPALQAGLSESERAAILFAIRYSDSPERKFLLERSYAVRYIPYDWRLNEHPSQ